MDSTSITAVFTGIVAVIGAVVAGFVVWNGRNMNKALATINNMTPGEQIDAATLARLRATPWAERTKAEQDHLDVAGPAEAPQGPTVAERTEAIYEAVNGKPEGQPSLYDMVQKLDVKVDGLVSRFDRLEDYVGAPHDSGEGK